MVAHHHHHASSMMMIIMCNKCVCVQTTIIKRIPNTGLGKKKLCAFKNALRHGDDDGVLILYL